MTADTHLAVYGTLAPGKPNHNQLDGLSGSWTDGVVRGTLVHEGWGADFGYPMITLDPEGPTVPVQLFRSPDLPAHWPRLDAFEGAEYRRVPVQVETAAGLAEAFIYARAG